MARMEGQANQISPPTWAGDWLDRNHLVPGGAKLDPTQFNANDAVVATVGAAGAAAGATSVPVGALSGPIPAGTILNFGAYAPVTVTVNDGSVAAGDTALTVQALSGPIPAGTVLDFSGGTNAQIARLSAAAVTGATSLTVEPLDGTIANTQTALFPGGTKQARLTAAAAAGATSLTVDELQFALVRNDAATYAGSGTKLKSVPSGTAIGRTYAERDALAGFGPAAAADDEIYLLAFTVENVSLNNDAVLYRHGGVVKENKLPAFATLASGVQTALRAAYTCTIGAD